MDLSESARYSKHLLTEYYMECGGNGIRRKRKMIKLHQFGLRQPVNCVGDFRI